MNNGLNAVRCAYDAFAIIFIVNALAQQCESASAIRIVVSSKVAISLCHQHEKVLEATGGAENYFEVRCADKDDKNVAIMLQFEAYRALLGMGNAQSSHNASEEKRSKRDNQLFHFCRNIAASRLVRIFTSRANARDSPRPRAGIPLGTEGRC